MTNHSPSYQSEPTRRIMCISDLHERWNTDRLRYSREMYGDILLVAGDLTFQGSFTKYGEFNDWVAKLNFKHKIVIPGNHDVTFESDFEQSEANMPEVLVLDQTIAEAEGLTIYGEPRQPEFYDWAYNVPRDRMGRDVWRHAPENIDILLTHGPPLGAGDLTDRGEHVGCEFQRKYILEHKPKLVVCGHIHSGYGIHLLGDTVVVNASICNEKYRALNAPIYINM